MEIQRRRFLHLAAGAAAMLSSMPRIAGAQTYPARPVRLIVAFAPGGVTDTFARLMGQKLGERLGQQFFVENITGATGNIGTGLAAKAAPDGYTLLFAFSSYVVNPTLFKKIPYDPYKDFEPVTLAVTSTTVVTIHPSVPAKTVKELVALISANPGKYTYASAGAGTQAHLAGEQFRLSLGLDLVHVPFNGGGPAIAAVVGGHTPIGFSSPAASIPQIRENNVRALAITSKTRSQILPDVPTMTEAGYPDIEGEAWFAVIVPARTPKDVVTLLHREIVRIIALPDMKERLAVLGLEMVGSTPEECAAQFRTELAKWSKVIRAAGIKAM